jgi:biotin carboxyl carrier protein
MKKLRVTIEGKTYDVAVEILDEAGAVSAPAPAAVAPPAPVAASTAAATQVPKMSAATAGDVVCPLTGKVVSIDVKVGDLVQEGGQVATVEAMKMNTYIYSSCSGKVSSVFVRPGEGVEEGLFAQLESLHAKSGRKITVIGWSLGGVYARLIASRRPDLVRSVITLGSPYAMRDPKQSHAHGPYRRLRSLHAPEARMPGPELRSRPIAVPSTSVYSRWDGVVAWQTCIEPETPVHQNVEVRCSHLGFGVDPATLWLIADRLAVPAGQQVQFRPPLALRPFYPR